MDVLESKASSGQQKVHDQSMFKTWRELSFLQCRHSKLGENDSFGLFCVFDGHNGAAAAQHIHDTLVEVPSLPSMLLLAILSVRHLAEVPSFLSLH